VRLSLADLDLERLTDEARRTLREIAWPIAEVGLTPNEIAAKLGLTRHELDRRRKTLRDEIEALASVASERPAREGR
jgi:hypothetical protein